MDKTSAWKKLLNRFSFFKYPVEKKMRFSFPFRFKEDESREVIYSDSFFMEDEETFSLPLAELSLSLALSSFSSNELKKDIKKQPKNIIAFLSDAGFKDIEVPPYFYEPSKQDGVAYAIGKKKIRGRNKFTLLAIGVRGGNYGKEWSSNFEVGDKGIHKGFALASSLVMEGLERYIKAHHIKGNLVIWIAGFSRGAALSNILAFHIRNGVMNLPKKAKLERLYAYCFACPHTSIEPIKEEKGIYNVLNPNDVITHFPCWGMRRFGTDIVLPYPFEPSFEEAMRNLEENGHGDFKDALSFSYVSLSPLTLFQKGKHPDKNNQAKKEFLEELDSFLNKRVLLPTFLSSYQESLKEVMALVDPLQEDPYQAIGDFSSAIIKEALERYGKAKFIGKALLSKPDWEEEMKPVIEKALEGKPYSIKTEVLAKMIGSLLETIQEDLIKNRNFYLTLSDKDNLSSLGTEHQPVLYLALLKGLKHQ